MDKLNWKKLSLTESCLIFLSGFFALLLLIKLKVILVPLLSAILLFLVFRPLDLKFQKVSFLNRTFASSLSLISSYSFIYLIFVCVAYVGSKISKILEQNENSLTRLTYKLDFSFLNFNFGVRDIDPNIIVNSVKQLSWGAMELGSFLLLVHVFLFFLFFDKNKNQKWEKCKLYYSDVGTYVGVKLLLASVTAAILGVVFSYFELKLTASLVILIFLLDLLPNIGALLAVLIPLPIAYFQYGTGVEFFSLLGALIAVQVVIGNFVEPKLVGKKLGLDPILVVISMVIWGLVWGAAGVFLAIPITLVLKKVLKQHALVAKKKN